MSSTFVIIVIHVFLAIEYDSGNQSETLIARIVISGRGMGMENVFGITLCQIDEFFFYFCSSERDGIGVRVRR